MLVSSCSVVTTCEFILEDDMKQKTQYFTEQHLVVFPTVLGGNIIPPGLIKYRKMVARGDNFQIVDVWKSKVMSAFVRQEQGGKRFKLGSREKKED